MTSLLRGLASVNSSAGQLNSEFFNGKSLKLKDLEQTTEGKLSDIERIANENIILRKRMGQMEQEYDTMKNEYALVIEKYQ
eukprot:CAMPEP_0116871318 /NCGR_PEP_ID=MMETSP0463-20121206/1589_1 /TAXON_ID=181622 /ORGANISM="Strombidinopsis sp, Strain SopsisLIS2011" /LENGTH=80 /DNA_ID=CAMNT_0004509461 /DNA_START=65 /DNA_END=307 /DNA_ORIENTATION=-